MRPEAGKALGERYRLVRQIAVGGMGEVWVARDESLAREIAIKVLKQEFVGNDDFLNRFRTEARNSASLSHANIAQLYDYGEQDGSAYLVMELVPGEPMSDLLERTPIVPIGRLLSILAQTSRALHAAHVGGVVHRDIKPGNILLEESGDVKITDFGVSLAANQIPMTAAGMVMGTAQYLSPEQAIGQAATGVSDIYALGIVAYEAIVGRRPFTGKTPIDIAIAHVNDAVPLLPASTDPELAALIMKMLAKDPVNRPRSAAALAHTFESLSARLGPTKASSGSPKATPAPQTTRTATPAGTPPIPSSRTSSSLAGGSRAPGAAAPTSKPEIRERTRSHAKAGSVKPLPPGAGSHAAGPHGSGVQGVRAPVAGPSNQAAPPQRSSSTQRSAQRQGSPVKASPTRRAAAPQRVQSPPRGQQRVGSRQVPATAPGSTRAASRAPTGLMDRIKALGPFTLVLILIVVLILGATVIRALTGETGVTSATTPITGMQTVQFISEQQHQSQLGSIEFLVNSNGDQNFPNVKDAKW